MLLIGYIWYVVVKGVGSEIGAHRYFTHRSFETTSTKSAILTWIQTLCGEGSVMTFVGIHRLHHSFSDTEKDPHSPLYYRWWEVVFFITKIDIPVNIVRDCLRNTHVRLQHHYYFKIHLVLLAIGVFFPVEYAYLVALPILLSVYTNGVINTVLHLHGEQHGEDSARNNRVLNTVLYGAGYHANHHSDAKNYRYNDNPLLDPIGEVIYRVFKKSS
jgi:stearoyl-CoA desaturase (delta-9 desaturase)